MKLLLLILILGEFLMASSIEKIVINGVKTPIIYEEDRSLPIVSLQLVFTHSGSIDDKNSPGLAKLSASMLSEGTLKMGADGFANALESKAIHLSVRAGVETLVFEIDALKEEFDTAIDLLKMLLKEPNLTQERLKKVKNVTIGQLSRKLNDFDYVASSELKSLLFKDTPLQSPASGTIDSVKMITIKQIKEFVDSHLQLKRAVVVIGGDIDKKSMHKSVTSLLGTLPIGSSQTLSHFTPSTKESNSTLLRDSEQAYLYFGSPYYLKVDDADNYKSRVAMYILGSGGFGSRLMEKIRVEKGLAYSAYSRANISASSSYFFGYLQTKNESLNEALESVKDVVDEFVSKGVSLDELEQAKKFLLGSEPLRVETLSQRLSRAFSEYYRGKELGDSLKELEKIRTLTLDDLNLFIKKHKEIKQLSYAVVKAK